MKPIVFGALALVLVATPALAIQRGHTVTRGHVVHHQTWHGGPAATHTTPRHVDPVQNDRAHSAPADTRVDRGPGVINGGRAVEDHSRHEGRWHHWYHCHHRWTGHCKD